MMRRLREYAGASFPTLFLLLAIVLGGASGAGAGALANGALQLLSLVVILYCVWAGRKAPLPQEAKPLLLLALVYLLVVLLSLLPLPAGVWQALPGRETAARGLGLIGLGNASLAYTLVPQATLSSLPWLLPPLAAFLLVLASPYKARKLLVGGVLSIAIVSVALGVVQLLSGPLSLRPYDITNPGLPVGFFANANHFGTLLLCALPFSGYIAARAVQRGSKTKKGSGMALASTTALFLIIGVSTIGSLAGYGLLIVTGAATLLVYRRAAAGALSMPWIAGAAALFLVFVGIALAGPLQEQALSGKLSDQRTSRKVMASTTIEAIKDTFPAGTGLGSLPHVYRTYENENAVGREFVNHTHNDYLELVLELGLPGLLLIVMFLAWWAWRSMRVWRSSFEGADLARAGTLVVLVVLLHSIVDYPARTSAIAALVATACALMVPPQARSRRRGRGEPAAEPSDLRHLEAD